MFFFSIANSLYHNQNIIWYSTIKGCEKNCKVSKNILIVFQGPNKRSKAVNLYLHRFIEDSQVTSIERKAFSGLGKLKHLWELRKCHIIDIILK